MNSDIDTYQHSLTALSVSRLSVSECLIRTPGTLADEILRTDYLPVYFQGVMGAGPIRSGIDMFPTAMIIPPFAMLAGASTQVFGVYRPANVFGWVFLTAGVGVMSLLRADSSVSQWVGYQVLAAAGAGLLVRCEFNARRSQRSNSTRP